MTHSGLRCSDFGRLSLEIDHQDDPSSVQSDNNWHLHLLNGDFKNKNAFLSGRHRPQRQEAADFTPRRAKDPVVNE